MRHAHSRFSSRIGNVLSNSDIPKTPEVPCEGPPRGLARHGTPDRSQPTLALTAGERAQGARLKKDRTTSRLLPLALEQRRARHGYERQRPARARALEADVQDGVHDDGRPAAPPYPRGPADDP